MPRLNPDGWEFYPDRQIRVNPAMHPELSSASEKLWDAVGPGLVNMALGGQTPPAGIVPALQTAVVQTIIYVLTNVDWTTWSAKSAGLTVVTRPDDPVVDPAHLARVAQQMKRREGGE